VRLIGNHHYGLCPDAFTSHELAALRRDLLASPYLGGSRLSDGFAGTRGFSLVFTRGGLSCARAELPFLAPYLARTLRPTCNAFYLNPLLMERGAAIAPHVDCTLAPFLGERVTPVMVGVLYVDVPDDLVGGELVLSDGAREVGRVAPRAGTLLYFGGRLLHHVTAVETRSTRLSLVCEQYKLPPDALARIPAFELQPGVGYRRS
jgi:hypothetical protein